MPMYSRSLPGRAALASAALALILIAAAAPASAGPAPATLPQAAAPAAFCDSVTQIPTAECQALVDLYNSTAGPGWTTKTGWLVTNTPCGWFGVTCTDSHVRKLELAINNLSGVLPASLGNLADLQELILARNQLLGPLPDSITTLGDLSNLLLADNQLSGPLPASIGNLDNLELFNISNNQLSGPLPASLGNLSDLGLLDIWSNPFSGALPTSLTNLDLFHFFFDSTDLCVPNDPALQAWLAGIPDMIGTDVTCALTLSKNITPVSPQRGAVSTYELIVTNRAAGTLNNIVLDDTLPAGVAYAGAFPAPSSVAGNALTWNLGTLNPGASFFVTLQVLPVLTPGRFQNQATVTAPGVDPAQASFVTDSFVRWADLDNDGDVDIDDVLQAGQRWQAGAFSIVQMQRVVYAWGS